MIAFVSVSSSAVAVTARLIGWRVFGSALMRLIVGWSLTAAVRAQSLSCVVGELTPQISIK